VQVSGANGVERVRVGMGKPRLAADDIPVLVNAEPPLITFLSSLKTAPSGR